MAAGKKKTSSPKPLHSILVSPRGYVKTIKSYHFDAVFCIPALSNHLFFFLILVSVVLFTLKTAVNTRLPHHVPEYSFPGLKPGNSDAMLTLPLHKLDMGLTQEELEFWQQPDGGGYRPCLHFSLEYRKQSSLVTKEKRRYLMVVVSGGLNQQRNQIADAVVITRILGAALVLPILEVNHVWRDDSEFSEVFDLEHFKKSLEPHVRIVYSLPSTHLASKIVAEKLPPDTTPLWIQSKFGAKLRENGVLLVKGFDSKLSKDLPPDLQKLRCKVAFHALRFAPRIVELGNKLARRMWVNGPYIALHLRLEIDVWVRTGCLPGLSKELDAAVVEERERHPELLTSKSNMTCHERRLAGLCPLNSMEVARVLKALGAPKSARIYCAGGEPLGGIHKSLALLAREFPNLYRKEMLSRPGELEPLMNRSSALAAVDYIVSLNSDVFMASHGGNMEHAIIGYRAYFGHRKSIKPNKRMIFAHMRTDAREMCGEEEEEFSRVMRRAHMNSMRMPELRLRRKQQDVTANPVPECMCKR